MKSTLFQFPFSKESHLCPTNWHHTDPAFPLYFPCTHTALIYGSWSPFKHDVANYHLDSYHKLGCRIWQLLGTFLNLSPVHVYSLQNLFCPLKSINISSETRKCCFLGEKGNGHLPAINSFKKLLKRCDLRLPKVQLLKPSKQTTKGKPGHSKKQFKSYCVGWAFTVSQLRYYSAHVFSILARRSESSQGPTSRKTTFPPVWGKGINKHIEQPQKFGSHSSGVDDISVTHMWAWPDKEAGRGGGHCTKLEWNKGWQGQGKEETGRRRAGTFTHPCCNDQIRIVSIKLLTVCWDWVWPFGIHEGSGNTMKPLHEIAGWQIKHFAT